MVRIRTRGPAAAASASWRVASMPSMPGMRMSISTTSGRCSRHSRTACGAVGRRADHGEVGLGGQQRARTPLRTTSWSSTDDDAGHRASLPARSAGSPRPGTRRRPGPAASSPPTIAARSRMPSRPCPPAGCSPGDGPGPLSRTRSTQCVAGVVAARRRPRRPARAGGSWSAPPGRCGTRPARRPGRAARPGRAR